MTDRELDRLAGLIAQALLASRDVVRAPSSGRGAPAGSSHGTAQEPWLPIPIRPEPPARGGEPPVWAGASQSLDDIAPGAESGSSARTSTADLTRATRTAAAGKGSTPETAPRGRIARTSRGADRTLEIPVSIGVSNRHIHLSAADARTLLGRSEPVRRRDLSQPGQFAAEETVAVDGPGGRIEGIRIVGPTRDRTQLELARSDARMLGIEPPLAASGSLEGSIGGVKVAGQAGSLPLTSGVIVAARHLHLAPADAASWGLRDGDRLDVRCGTGPRSVTFHDVLVRSGPGHATELHLDVDEANAAGVRTGDRATILRVRGQSARRRPLITERDVHRLARAGGALPADALLTPSARDRAQALGLMPAR